MLSVANSVFRFGSGVVDGDGSMRDLLGGKGAGLAEMVGLSVPVPPGFTITTDVCREYMTTGALNADHFSDIDEGLQWLERETGKSFGDADNPLLVSVRSGAPISMPGMMDTILNVGLNDVSVVGLASRSGSERFAYDSYKRLLQMFGSVVMGVPKAAFEQAIHEAKAGNSGLLDENLDVVLLCREIEALKTLIQQHTGEAFPQDTKAQLTLSVEAVFRSWHSERARYYRKLNNISEAMGTAVTVQAMVFGNLGLDSGTGVGFTRNPSTGAASVFGEYLANAQGEDIVAGVRTPVAISELADQLPEVYDDLTRLVGRLEHHYRDTQDFEFTVESGKLFLLQTRSAKRSALAAVRIAVEMVGEGLITREEAISRVAPGSLTEVLSPHLDLSIDHPVAVTSGLPASPGAAVGVIALSSDSAVAMHRRGARVILVTQETTAEDIHGMAASAGFLTARGGATSHAAVVARGMGKCCITGAKGITIDFSTGTLRIGNHTFIEGDWLSLEGSTGQVFAGQLPLCSVSEKQPELEKLLEWAIEGKSLAVRANSDTPEDAAASRAARAIGIGLCRTEHMFFASDRLKHMRSMIMADSETDRVAALEVLLPMQERDFEEIFRTMGSLPVTIRLLDPPLHEFLPSIAEINAEIANTRRDEDWEGALSLEATRQRVESLIEANPMMGHRGCRLSLTYPEILRMQVKAILLAALTVAGEGLDPCPEIMVPLVASEEEMRVLAEMIHSTATDLFLEHGKSVDYKIGTMIELPRAAICAGPISRHVSFISFGTNDLTQMTYGFSRDDSYNFLESYLQQGILKADPFVTIDQEGVGALIQMAVRSARAENPTIKIGVCGEHGGDPASIQFFKSLALDYVSCSPSRLKIAQLAAAKASTMSQ